MSGVTNSEVTYEDKKPTNLSTSSTHINIKLKGQDGVDVLFRVKRSTPLKIVLETYCEKRAVDFKVVVFLLNGDRFKAWHKTPDELNLEDGDEIDAMLHQAGGAVA